MALCLLFFGVSIEFIEKKCVFLSIMSLFYDEKYKIAIDELDSL